MKWTRSDTLALANQHCAYCRGFGLTYGFGEAAAPCNCVLRSIFRICYARFRHCATKEKHLSRTSVEYTAGRDSRFCWGRKDEEYVADFCSVTRRNLSAYEYRIFSYHYLLGADWKLCCRQLNLDRGTFFHSVYRLQQKLGRVFRELQPYGLFPLEEYFHGVSRSMETPMGPTPPAVMKRPIPARLAFPEPLLRAA